MASLDRLRLCEEGLGLVHFTVNRDFRNTGFEVGDLDGVGYIGLVKAARYYNPKKGQFSTYAVRLIKNEIINFLHSHQMQKRKISRDRLIPLEKDFTSDDGRTMTMAEFVSDETSGRPFDQVENRILVEELLSHLSVREREFIIKNFGLYGRRPMGTREIAAEVGVSYQRVGFVVREALKKMWEVLAMEYTELTKGELSYYVRSIKKAMGWRWEDMGKKTGIPSRMLADYASLRHFPRDPEKVVMSIRKAVKEEMKQRRAKQAI